MLIISEPMYSRAYKNMNTMYLNNSFSRFGYHTMKGSKIVYDNEFVGFWLVFSYFKNK